MSKYTADSPDDREDVVTTIGAGMVDYSIIPPTYWPGDRVEGKSGRDWYLATVTGATVHLGDWWTYNVQPDTVGPEWHGVELDEIRPCVTQRS